MDDELDAYGHIQLSIWYQHLVDVEPTAFVYQGRRYVWSNVLHVEVRQVARFGLGSFSHLNLVPRAHIQLSDGRTITIRGHTLVKRRGVLRQGFDSPFNELVALFQEERSAARRFKMEATHKRCPMGGQSL